MTKEETAPGGLLSKVVRFVRNPTVDWSELDSMDESREAKISRQKLKDMIERKRRNDFVRKREFDQLRKLRRKEANPGLVQDDTPVQTSFLDTDVGEREARAQTLLKIDAIEQQMSQQWWKASGATAPAGLQAGGSRAPSPPPPDPGAAPGETTLAPSHSGSEAGAWTDPLQAFAPTMPSRLQSRSEEEEPSRALFREDNAPDPSVLQAQPQAGDATSAPREEKFVHEPDLEEAAILFANADYAGAARCLTDVLVRHAQDDPADQHEIWMTLFDLYRATGQQEPFDALAIDYAAQYGRASPLWFSMPAQLGVEAVAEEPAAAQRELAWNAPATLGQQSMAALQASLARSSPPWTLNWSRLTDIEAAALPALTELLGRWANEAVELHFQSVAVLQQVVQARTVAEDRSVDPQWWLLRMALLRLLRLPDDFEMVALDYCVTYEVSPPSWVDPKCSLLDGAAALEAVLESDAPAAGAGAALAELTGHIEGDAQAQLARLEAMARPGQPLVIACDRLIRIDFAAVGSVLNWAATQQAQGCELHFHNLHRVIAVFFNVIGINDHAWVEPRKN